MGGTRRRCGKVFMDKPTCPYLVRACVMVTVQTEFGCSNFLVPGHSGKVWPGLQISSIAITYISFWVLVGRIFIAIGFKAHESCTVVDPLMDGHGKGLNSQQPAWAAWNIVAAAIASFLRLWWDDLEKVQSTANLGKNPYFLWFIFQSADITAYLIIILNLLIGPLYLAIIPVT